MKNFLEFINELKLHKLTESEEYYFILHKGIIYTFEDKEGDINSIVNLLNIEEDIEDIYDLSIYIEENHPYILIGEYNDGEIILTVGINYKPSAISDDVRKLKKFLNAYNVKFINRYGKYLDGEEFLNINIEELKEAYFYHGTCLEYLNNILTFGIKPIEGVTNFKDIQHGDKIFITTDRSKAIFHADKCALNVNSVPVILKFKVPDLNKLFPDFDLVINFYGKDSKYARDLDYHNIKVGDFVNKSMSFLSKEDEVIDLSKKFGLYAYKGRIPSKFIESISTLDNFIEEPSIYKELEEYHNPSWESFSEYNKEDFLDEFSDYI